MAVDDVISDWQSTLTNGAGTALQPASGVEWLVTWVGMTTTDTSHLFVTSLDTGNQLGVAINAGETSPSIHNQIEYFMQGGGQRFFTTNSQYPVIMNNTGSTRKSAFSGIQTK